MTKTCTKCRVEKDTAEFYKRSTKWAKDGLQSWCKRCFNDDVLDRQKRLPERSRKAAAKWKAANPERSQAGYRAWCEANKERVRAYGSKRRAMLRGATIEEVDRAYVIARDNSRCHICGGSVAADDINLDHLVPLSKGGEHSHRNLAVAHSSCNKRRKDGRQPAQLLLIG